MIVKGENRDTAWYSIIDTEWPALKRVYEEWLDPANFDNAGQQRRRLEEIRAGLATVARLPLARLKARAPAEADGPSSWAKSPQLPSASPVNEAENQQKQHCAQSGADDGGDDPRAKMDTQSR